MHEKAPENSTGGLVDALNPLNNIPTLAQSRTSSSQRGTLPLERTASSIPRVRSNSTSSSNGNGAAAATSACPVVHTDGAKAPPAAPEATADDANAENWVYPSPQQFYNALARKGKEAPEESIEVMVQIHNFLNERAWDEVRRWEDRRNPGERIELARFEGRPQDLSPRARWHLWLGSLFPNTYRCASHPATAAWDGSLTMTVSLYADAAQRHRSIDMTGTSGDHRTTHRSATS